MTDETAQRMDMRTREGRAAADAQRAASLAVAEQAHAVTSAASTSEITTPGGKRISRETRRGFGSQDQKLAYPQRQGYHRHWFNDTPGRISRALESGWTHVKNEINGNNEREVVGVAQIGGALHAYLMEIPEEWYQDDMDDQEKLNASKEEAIKGGVQAQKPEDISAFYPTAQGRRLTITRR